MEDDDHAMWVYMPCGLARIERSEWYAWIDDPRHVIKTTLFESSDGVPSVAVYGSSGPRVTKAPDGKIWFVQREGVSVIDPQHLPYNKVPPPVQIEQITADRKRYYDSASFQTSAAHKPLRLPALSRDLQIDYTALSLVEPEKVLFRYKLEGFDADWYDAGNRRQAFYTNLPPRKYRFRVMACNNSGVWSEDGATFDFSIAPVYYQTAWFRGSCVIAFLALLWSLYELRRRQLQQQFAIGAEARVDERTRIARELHDTLLQGFHGLMFEFQAVRNMFARNPERALEALDSAILQTEEAIAESRSAIQDLRAEPVVGGDLAQSLTSTSRELAATCDAKGSGPTFRMVVEGARKKLPATVQDEVYRIGREVLRNAYRHAQAHRIEAEIRYDAEEFRLRIRDDGKGVGAKVLAEGGVAGHWGLSGIPERAKQIGAQLHLWSEAGAGTEVQLTIPAAVAYGSARDRGGFKLFRMGRKS